MPGCVLGHAWQRHGSSWHRVVIMASRGHHGIAGVIFHAPGVIFHAPEVIFHAPEVIFDVFWRVSVYSGLQE